MLFFFTTTATTEIYTLSLHDALPISWSRRSSRLSKHSNHSSMKAAATAGPTWSRTPLTRPRCLRSEEHTSELQSLRHLVCRLLLEKKKKKQRETYTARIQELSSPRSA